MQTRRMSRVVAGWRWLPRTTTADAPVLLAARGLRAFADGFVSVLLPVYLLNLGLDGIQIGAVATATLLGSAALTLLVGLIAHRFQVRRLLASAAVLMMATGVCFAFVHEFVPLLVERASADRLRAGEEPRQDGEPPSA